MLTVIITTIASCKPTPTEELAETPRYDVEVYGNLESSSPSEQVIVFWYPYTQDQEETLLALVDEFNTTNEWNITVIAEYAGPTDTIYEKIQARIGAGALPEIVIAEQYQAAAYAAQDALVALNPYVESEKWGYTQEELDDFFPVALNAEMPPQLEDRYGWPIYRSTEVLYYNADWLAELGYTEPPKTWDEFSEMACAASDPAAGTHGYELSTDASTFADMLANRGGQMIDENARAYTFNAPEGLEVLTFLRELFTRDCTILRTEQLGDRTDFGTGTVLFTTGNITNLPHYQSSVARGAGFKWSIAPLPTSLDTPKMYIYGPDFSIFRSTPEKQLAAWLFLKWFTEPEQQARWVRATHTLPVRISTTDLLQDYLVENPQYEKGLSFLAYDATTEPNVTGYDECRDAIEKMLAAVAELEHPETWLTSTANACNAYLEAASQ